MGMEVAAWHTNPYDIETQISSNMHTLLNFGIRKMRNPHNEYFQSPIIVAL